MTIDIPQGTFSELVKTGVYFSIDNDDRVFTGDLYYDFALREFQIRGIPAKDGKMQHIFEPAFRGPVQIDMLLLNVIDSGPTTTPGQYSVVKFRNARASSALATHLEEWHGDRSMMQAIDEFFQIKQDLTWYK